MPQSVIYGLAADGVLLLHVAFVVFVVVGLLLIVAGKFLNWTWIGDRWFRIVHLLAIALVMLESWTDVVCPLTAIEQALRSNAGDATYAGSFIAHWLETLLYFDASPWVFTLCYSIFAVLVAATWFWIPPRRPSNVGQHVS